MNSNLCRNLCSLSALRLSNRVSGILRRHSLDSTATCLAARVSGTNSSRQRAEEAAKSATPADSIRLIGRSRRAFERSRPNRTSLRGVFPECRRDSDCSDSTTSTGRTNGRRRSPAWLTFELMIIPECVATGLSESGNSLREVSPVSRPELWGSGPQFLRSFLQAEPCGGRIEFDSQSSPGNLPWSVDQTRATLI